jgi:hypothetical protein
MYAAFVLSHLVGHSQYFASPDPQPPSSCDLCAGWTTPRARGPVRGGRCPRSTPRPRDRRRCPSSSCPVRSLYLAGRHSSPVWRPCTSRNTCSRLQSRVWGGGNRRCWQWYCHSQPCTAGTTAGVPGVTGTAGGGACACRGSSF